MRRVSLSRAALLCMVLAWVALSSSAYGGVDVLVGRFDAVGTGANLHETTLTTANINTRNFGKLFSYEVEGAIYAQPLIVSDISVRGRLRNVLYVATTNNMIYALDADDPGPHGGLLWQVRLAEHGAFPVPGSLELVPTCPANPQTCGADRTIRGNMGILSTPVIDRSRNTIYALARTIESAGYVQRLHALDLITGREKASSPVKIAASVQVMSGQGTTIIFRFDPKFNANRAGLALAHSNVILAWTAIPKDVVNKNPTQDYHGWVMAYDADTLRQTGVFCTTCAQGPEVGGGIWQSGRPPAVDPYGYVYYFIGNGWLTADRSSFAAACNPSDGNMSKQTPAGYYAEHLVKLDPANGLRLASKWRPINWCALDGGDLDLGGSGPALINVLMEEISIPPAHSFRPKTLVVGGGKDGQLYVIDAEYSVGDQLEAVPVLQSPASRCVRPPPDSAPAAAAHHIMAGPVYWHRNPDVGRSLVFVSLENDCVHAFPVADVVKSTRTFGIIDQEAGSTTSAYVVAHPGAILSLSANGDKPGSGVLWISYASNNSNADGEGAVWNTMRGRLAAFDAEHLEIELWNSDQAGERDAVGYFAKFAPATIANGKVYLGTFPRPEPYVAVPYKNIMQTYQASNSMSHLVVYGLNPPPQPPIKSFVPELLPSLLSP
jgi:hypothetical protein